MTITHDQRIADRAARVLRVEDGLLVEEGAAAPTYLDGGHPLDPTAAPGDPRTGAAVGPDLVVPSASGLAALGLAGDEAP